MKKGIGYVSLFSGGMGLDLGLEAAGFAAAVCNEIDACSVETIRRNRPKIPVVDRSVADIGAADLEAAAGRALKELPLVAGGPPCQAFSVYGKRMGTVDQRGQLIYEFLRVVSELRPKTFLMENVRGLHSMAVVPKTALSGGKLAPALAEHGSLLREIFRRFEAVGYRVDCFIVNSVNYGAPQIRERLVCVGNRFNLRAKFPEPRYSNRPEDGLPPFRTLGDALGDGFVDPDPSCMNFSPRKLKYLAMVPAGGNWRSLPVEVQKESMGKAWHLKGGRSAYWRKLSFEFPSPTVVTMPNHAGTSMCHPTELRALTVGELAAVQEFPCDWQFSGSATDKCRQIGNAVPVRLGEVAGGVVKALLKTISERGRTPAGKPIPSEVTHLRPHVRTRTFWKKGEAFAGDHSYYDDEGEGEGSRQPSLFDDR
jgi:DNA (cytosine-5)-methyltransferase 1